MSKTVLKLNVYIATALIVVIAAATLATYVIIHTGTSVNHPRTSPSTAPLPTPSGTASPAPENFTPSPEAPSTPTSVPVISQSPTATINPISTPTLMPLPTPTSAPTPITTPFPTLAPTPTPTPIPSPFPILTSTPSPSPTSSPIPTPTPSQTVTKSENWAGYFTASDLQNPQPIITGVTASWAVPAVAPTSNDTFSAIWIGVGGKFDQTLIQCGTEQDYVGGLTQYSAWYELLPRNSRSIFTIHVSSGDEMQASIQLLDQTTDEWAINITDVTSGQSFQVAVAYASSQLSAEWIVERPTVNHVLSTLADFGTISLSNCTTSVGQVTGTIGSFPTNQIVMYSTIATGSSSVQLTNVSGINADDGGFTVDYLASN